jgi:ABC-2 type transport system permease protein
MRFIIIGVPVVEMLVFGYAATTDVRNIRTAVYDLDDTPQSRDLVARFSGSRTFQIVRRLGREAEIRDILDRGTAKAVLRVDRGFAGDLAAGRSARVQLLLDGTDSNTAGLVMGYASAIVASFNDRAALERMEALTGMKPPGPMLAAASRAWFNPDLESRNYFLPGVIALLLMVTTVVLSCMAIVREREIGTMEQILVTPIGRLEFILGKTIPFALIGYLDVVLISVVAVFWFDIPIRGNPLILFGSTGLYLLSTLGAGLFLSTVSRTQQQAVMTAIFFMLPALLLSGFIYPIANMPSAVQWLTYVNPLRYFLVILRGVFLKGVGLHVLWPQMAALALLGAGLLLLAAGRFRKTMA